MMKKQLLLLMSFVALASAAGAQTTKNTTVSGEVVANAADEQPVFNWEKSTYDFGRIAQGKPVSTVFHFTNSGKQPLVISQVNTTCGCTVADYTREAVLPGKKGSVTVTYNAGAKGVFTKTITVHANTSMESQYLNINGEVVTDPVTQ